MASILSRPQWVKTVFVDQMTSFRMTREVSRQFECSVHSNDVLFQFIFTPMITHFNVWLWNHCQSRKQQSQSSPNSLQEICRVSISRRSFYAWELPLDRLIFIMGIDILARRHLCVKTEPQVVIISLCPTNATMSCMWSISPVHQLRNNDDNNNDDNNDYNNNNYRNNNNYNNSNNKIMIIIWW